MIHKLVSLYIGDGEYYTRIDTDSVIADLEESHKKEVEQLLIEIVELKAQKAQAEDDCAYWKMREGNAVNAMHETEEACMFLTKSECHQKYKRCLAMANYWVAVSYHCVDDKHRQKAEKRHYKWLELAEKYKE